MPDEDTVTSNPNLEARPTPERVEPVEERESAVTNPEAFSALRDQTLARVDEQEAETIRRAYERIRSAEGSGAVPDHEDRAVVRRALQASDERIRGLGDRTRAAIDEVARSVAPRGRPEFPAHKIEVPVPAGEVPPQAPEPTEIIRQELVEREAGMGAESAYDPEVERLYRDVQLAESLERLERGEKLEERERYQIIGALEGRGWHKAFERVQERDAVAAFLVPSGEMFSIKHMNDNLFGMQKTDDIIDERRNLLVRKLGTAGLERIAHSFKDEYYRIARENMEGPEERQEAIAKLHHVVEEMRQEMTEYITAVCVEEEPSADEKRKEHLRAFLDSLIGEQAHAELDAMREEFLTTKRVFARVSQNLHEAEERLDIALAEEDEQKMAEASADLRLRQVELPEARARYEELKRRLSTDIVAPALRDPSRGYRVTFGISEVGARQNGRDFTNVERSVSEALKGAMLARETAEGGKEFAEKDVERMLAELKRLRSEMLDQDIIDADGNMFPLFERKPGGYAVMNMDVLRDVRKGKLSVSVDRPDQQELLRKVKEYMKHVNYLDVMKPYTHEEISGADIYGTEYGIADQVKTVGDLVKRMRTAQPLTEGERASIGTYLREEGKDRTCTSAMEFNTRAIEIPECTYLSLDVLDVGPELYQEFDRLLQEVEKGERTFEEAQLIAGDATTRKMRRFRDQVTKAYEALTGEEPLMYVGGDEVVLAMDTAKVTDDFVITLRKIDLDHEREGRRAGSVRVIKTVVSGSERSSNTSDVEATVREHLDAKKRAETGTEIAKRIEQRVRAIEHFINILPKEERGEPSRELERHNVRHFAVKQGEEGRERDFELVVQATDREGNEYIMPADLDVVMDGLAQLEQDLKKRVERYRDALLKELHPAYPLVTERNIMRILRRKNRESDEEFNQFIKHFE